MKKFHLPILLVLLLLAIFFWSKDLTYPPKPYFDEVYYVPVLNGYVAGNIEAYDFKFQVYPGMIPYDWTHPPLAKLISSIGVKILGDKPFGWRVPSLILGLGSLGIFYLLARKLFPKNQSIALISLFLFVFDLLPIVQSRIVMSDIDLVFFSLLSFYIFLLYLRKPSFLKLVLLGVCSGALISIKWNGGFIIPILSIVLLFERIRSKGFYLPQYLAEVVTIIVIALFIYLVSYSQYFLIGGNWKTWWELQKAMLGYHSGLKATHNYQASWWSWPLMIRPTWYSVEYLPDGVRNIYALGNPLIWWSGLGSLGYLGISWIIKRRFEMGLILIGYLGFWLPWVLSPRITFLHHYLPSLPFLYLSLGVCLNWVLGNLGRLGRGLVLSYLLVVVVCFLYFYPIAVGEKLTKSQLEERFWISSWK